MQTALVLARPDGSLQEVALKRARLVVGRHQDCQIRLNDPAVSRQHCEIIVEGDRAIIRDLGSSNGTFVNKRRVSQTELGAGDLIAIGPFVFALRVDGAPAKLDAADLLARGSVPIGGGKAPAPAAAAKSKPAKPAAAPPKDSDDEFDPLKTDPVDSDSSSEFDFDFLDEKDQPKL